MFLVGFGSSVHAQYGGTAGAFARIGFGARGVAMGNAMTAVVSGKLSPYYNPALTAFQSDHVITAAYTVMSLDRSLNFLQYSQHLKKSAGIAVGFINSGVSKIDGRDSDGISTGDLSTSEYLFFASFANSFTDKLACGVTFKYYYYKLYENITAYSAAVDLGCIYSINKNMSVGIAVNDLGAKYRWDTSKIYGDQGTTTIDAFPTIIKIGVAHTLFDSTVTAAIDYVASSQNTHHLRVGVEWNPLESFSLRGDAIGSIFRINGLVQCRRSALPSVARCLAGVQRFITPMALNRLHPRGFISFLLQLGFKL